MFSLSPYVYRPPPTSARQSYPAAKARSVGPSPPISWANIPLLVMLPLCARAMSEMATSWMRSGRRASLRFWFVYTTIHASTAWTSNGAPPIYLGSREDLGLGMAGTGVVRDVEIGSTLGAGEVESAGIATMPTSADLPGAGVGVGTGMEAAGDSSVGAKATTAAGSPPWSGASMSGLLTKKMAATKPATTTKKPNHRRRDEPRRRRA